MIERELLELAAKAAGLNIKGYRVDIDDNFTHVVVGKKGTREKTNWNPLTDDGDALRLAVKLGIAVEHFYSGTLEKHEWMFSRARRFQAEAICGRPGDIDPYVATRRAIVRVAAEIGRQMEEGGEV